jgi:hypothetical protein
MYCVRSQLGSRCSDDAVERVPEASVEILGHSIGGITDRHYAQPRPCGPAE